MGIWQAIKNIAAGKNVYSVPPADTEYRHQMRDEMAAQQARHQQGTAAPGAQPGHPPTGAPQHPVGPKVMPNVYIERCISRHDSSHLDCELFIKNHHDKPVRLERLEFLGQTYNLNKTYLLPGREWEYPVHGGARPTSTAYHECKLYFETEDGDDFYSAHRLEYKQLPDRTYMVDHIRFMPPSRDI